MPPLACKIKFCQTSFSMKDILNRLTNAVWEATIEKTAKGCEEKST